MRLKNRTILYISSNHNNGWQHSLIPVVSFLLLFLGTVRGYAQRWDASIDPQDTIDEVDLKALKDKIPMSRNNVADVVVKMNDFEHRYRKKLTKANFEQKTGIKLDSVYKSASWSQLMTMVDTMKVHKTGSVNGLDYVLDDYYSPEHETFISDPWRHVYVGMGGAVEKFFPQGNGYEITPVGQVYAMIGKDFTMKHSARVLIGGGWGYDQLTKYSLKRVSLRADYLYNLSTNFGGYNPTRRFGFTGVLGLGAHYTMMQSRKSKIVPEAHLGLQVQVYTGPLGVLSLEPYIGIAPDHLDLSETRNWKGYDAFAGVQLNYAFYLREHLSQESKLRLLQYRSDVDRVVDSLTLDSWRTSWFVEAMAGVSYLNSDAISMGKSRGSEISIGVGRWFSPVIGGRLSLNQRNTNYKLLDYPAITNQGVRTVYYPMRYTSVGAEILINPLGFLRDFTWDRPWGFSIVAGGEYGMVRQTLAAKLLNSSTSTESMRTYSAAYNLGAHVWYKLSEDLQAFVEPKYTHNIYTAPYSNVDMNKMFADSYLGLNFGLTMFIRSEKFHDLYEFDEIQKFNYRNVRGARIGIAGGLLNLQRNGYDFGGGDLNWSFTAFGEYRFDFLHSVRGSFELFNLSRQALVPCQNAYTVNNTDYTTNGKRIYDVSSQVALFALDYQINLTNLCSGILKDRRFELEAFAGPAASLHLNRELTLGTNEPLEPEGCVVTPLAGAEDRKLHFGANAGLKLTAYVWKGISLFFSPNIYLIKNNTPELNTNTNIGSNIHMYQSFSLGIQYKCGKARFNPFAVRRLRERLNQDWKDRQAKAASWYQKGVKYKQAKRRKEYNEWLKKQKEKQAKKKQSKYIIIEVDAKD